MANIKLTSDQRLVFAAYRRFQPLHLSFKIENGEQNEYSIYKIEIKFDSNCTDISNC